MRDRTRGRWLLAATLLSSSAALVLVSWWLLREPGTAKAEALKTGGLAGGAILALYALWINDRRRRTEEARHEVERARAELDRDRVADERFAKAVELLGNDADQVRVGAMHVLAGLARTRPDYTQTVLDVLCSYLRRPFNPRWTEPAPDDADEADRDRERQVRQTAQRLIRDLLPGPDAVEPPLYDLDLTSAGMEYLDLAQRQVGSLVARRAQMHGVARLNGLRVHRPALFSRAVFHARVDASGAEFAGGLSLYQVRINGEWNAEGATVREFLDLRTPAPATQVGELLVADGTYVQTGEDDGWAVRRTE